MVASYMYSGSMVVSYMYNGSMILSYMYSGNMIVSNMYNGSMIWAKCTVAVWFELYVQWQYDCELYVQC